MRSTYKFYAWSSTGGAGNAYGTVHVDWTYNASAKTITITGVTYGGSNVGWYVGSSMKMGIKWSDGQETELANGTYNYPYVSQESGAGFVDKGSAKGVFSDANRACPKTHTFSGSSGGFTVAFGSTASTINAGNPQSYRNLERLTSDNPSVTFTSPPTVNCNNVYTKNPSVWRLQSGISGINWGTGYSSRTLTATVSYTFQGTNYSYEAGKWTDGRTSASIDVNAYNDSEPWKKVPAGANATVKWTMSTNIGSTSCSSTVYSKAPDTPTLTTIITSNPSVYRLASTVSGINWGDYHKSTSLYAKVTGTIDGNTISWTTTPVTTGATSGSFDYNALVNDPSAPWLKVPDDETVTVTWYAAINVGYGTLTGTISKAQYCQPSYTAYVIEEGVNDGKPVEADCIISNATGSAPNKVLRRVTTIDGGSS